MDREELIEILYENNVRADISIEDLADEIIRAVENRTL